MSAALIVVLVVVALLLMSGGVVLTRRRPGLRRPTPSAPPAPPPPAPSGTPVVPPGATVETPATPSAAPAAPAAPVPAAEERAPEAPRPGLRQQIGRARAGLAGQLGLLRGRQKLDDSLYDELEETLILADVGVTTTRNLLEGLRQKVRAGEVPASPGAVIEALGGEVAALFAGDDPSLSTDGGAPAVWLVVGVNGAGKTTTIGKLAAREVAAGRKVVLAAGDTFRAAAGEQLGTWAERSGASLIEGAQGADPSSVVFDAVQHAAARGADLVIADSAGRLHTKTNLMEELKKVRRIADRPPGHVTEVLLVLDATTGQNGLAQARQFTEAVGVTGIVLTKLDGTAKGGIVLAIRAELGLPIKLVGLGEGKDDLVEFDPGEFASALFGD